MTDTRGTTDPKDWKPLELRPKGRTGAEAISELLADKGNFGELLAREKAVVFRDFDVAEQDIETAMDLLLPNRLAYMHGTSPRTKLGGNLYTSTEYPQHMTIAMHNELSYSHHWPERLFFYCATTPGSGGATPVVDGGLWLDSLDEEVRDAFAAGIRYTQNLHDGFGLGRSWRQTFETDDRAAVEAFLEQGEFDWQWTPDGGLRMISPVRPATVKHPYSGTEVWFNQADHFHPAALGDETSRELAQILPPEELPQSVTFADGSPIPDAYALHVHDIGLEAAVDVDWRQGDLMVIDNVAVGHGRRPFGGDRRVLVAMSD
ncbi:TauD/TfdA family dioxygenase [Streptomyces sp. BE133]|uniref:TauD/TfdA family dioxygenase n=1 Tax=Streptomyces sp. BE133 TaxID=3002523 RepID=UPI002E794658|nr:TauD/TfdA family dioxygenase [Streptomyces sp. BE133]MEE1806752.1 TauD/TfdA family dioxygenase [Streptomyces sp. BE133]